MSSLRVENVATVWIEEKPEKIRDRLSVAFVCAGFTLGDESRNSIGFDVHPDLRKRFGSICLAWFSWEAKHEGTLVSVCFSPSRSRAERAHSLFWVAMISMPLTAIFSFFSGSMDGKMAVVSSIILLTLMTAFWFPIGAGLPHQVQTRLLRQLLESGLGACNHAVHYESKFCAPNGIHMSRSFSILFVFFTIGTLLVFLSIGLWALIIGVVVLLPLVWGAIRNLKMNSASLPRSKRYSRWAVFRSTCSMTAFALGLAVSFPFAVLRVSHIFSHAGFGDQSEGMNGLFLFTLAFCLFCLIFGLLGMARLSDGWGQFLGGSRKGEFMEHEGKEYNDAYSISSLILFTIIGLGLWTGVLTLALQFLDAALPFPYVSHEVNPWSFCDTSNIDEGLEQEGHAEVSTILATSLNTFRIICGPILWAYLVFAIWDTLRLAKVRRTKLVNFRRLPGTENPITLQLASYSKSIRVEWHSFRSSSPNAYVAWAGFFCPKLILALPDNVAEDHLEALAAHEIGHFVLHRRKIRKARLLSFLFFLHPRILDCSLNFPAMEEEADEFAVGLLGGNADASNKIAATLKAAKSVLPERDKDGEFAFMMFHQLAVSQTGHGQGSSKRHGLFVRVRIGFNIMTGREESLYQHPSFQIRERLIHDRSYSVDI